MRVGEISMAVLILTSTVAGAPPPAVSPFSAEQARAHQEAWAKHLGVTVETRNSVDMTMVLVPPGGFVMGTTTKELIDIMAAARKYDFSARENQAEKTVQHESPTHRVVLTKPLLFGKTEVTVAQFRKFAEKTYFVSAAEKRREEMLGDPNRKPGLNPPTWRHEWRGMSPDDWSAIWLTHAEMIAFCNWLSRQEGFTPCYSTDDAAVNRSADGYRLPTEAEWEFACRGGTTTAFSFGDAFVLDYAWCRYSDMLRGQQSSDLPHPVAKKKPNPFGLFDMHGNAGELCEDFYDPQWYEKSPVNDPTGPDSGRGRVARGGGFNRWVYHCRSAARSSHDPTYPSSYVGFRVVRSTARLD